MTLELDPKSKTGEGRLLRQYLIRSPRGKSTIPGSSQAQQPFSRFVLAAPHDNRMNSMQSADAVLSAIDTDMAADLRRIIPRLEFFSHIPDSALVHMLPNIVYGLPVTQKQEIPVMLALGARYFDFRPGELLPMFQKGFKTSQSILLPPCVYSQPCI